MWSISNLFHIDRAKLGNVGNKIQNVSHYFDAVSLIFTAKLSPGTNVGRHYANILIRAITLVIFLDPEDGSHQDMSKIWQIKYLLFICSSHGDLKYLIERYNGIYPMTLSFLPRITFNRPIFKIAVALPQRWKKLHLFMQAKTFLKAHSDIIILPKRALSFNENLKSG